MLSSFAYTLDPAGNPTSVTTPDGTTSYSYDALDRLNAACFPSSCSSLDAPSIRYTYDPVGNRTSAVASAGTTSGATSYSYNAADQLISQTGPAGTASYSYDANGNQTQAGARTFRYDLANRLIATTNAQTTTSYSYDGDGNRLTVSSGPGASQTSRQAWDVNFSLPQLALERDSAGATLRSYAYGNQLVSMNAGGQPFYYHYDGLGNVTNLTSTAGAPQWRYAYEPYGVTAALKLSDTAPQNPIQFTGQYFDSESGLYHLRARHYDETTGRFLQPDPVPATLTIPTSPTTSTLKTGRQF